ncbi:hypothetical protein MLD38_024377 [Melastoma candidum]|uniref:Uncharacterized protein n=1 Tax=Melastoma candidum TaxID=119954 RepID=A0ACB9NS42_9MYRT|nr:hypothetical protein MLD38_024377 [Melastoma candidum]
MVPALPASITLLALSLVTFSSLLFLAIMWMDPPFHSVSWAELHASSRYEGRRRNRRPSLSQDEEEEEEEEEDCAVCLCRLEVGDQIKELGCYHVFHMVCFDRWAGHCRHPTCPLCRRMTRGTEVYSDQDGVEVLSFRLWDFSGNGDRESNWWLR